MRHLPFLQPLLKILVVVLCVSLAAPAGRAVESAGPPVVEKEAVASQDAPAADAVPAKPGPDSPQLLSDEELSQLAARAEEPGPEVVGGALSNEHLTYIAIALAAAVIVLIVK